MARSAWKYLVLYSDDLYKYFNNLIKDSYKSKIRFQDRDRTINLWNYKRKCKIYNGKISRHFSPNQFLVNLKFGIFSKTRKPFFFRSKKKKR